MFATQIFKPFSELVGAAASASSASGVVTVGVFDVSLVDEVVVVGLEGGDWAWLGSDLASREQKSLNASSDPPILNVRLPETDDRRSRE